MKSFSRIEGSREERFRHTFCLCKQSSGEIRSPHHSLCHLFIYLEVDMLTDKYRPILDLANQLHIGNINTTEDKGKLVIKGTAPYQLEKDLLWDKIKSFNGWENEVTADIQVEHDDVFGKYKVQSGDTLSKVAQKFYGDSAKYRQIFDANRDVLKDPNKINVGQELTLPKP